MTAGIVFLFSNCYKEYYFLYFIKFQGYHNYAFIATFGINAKLNRIDMPSSSVVVVCDLQTSCQKSPGRSKSNSIWGFFKFGWERRTKLGSNGPRLVTKMAAMPTFKNLLWNNTIIFDRLNELN